MIIDLRVHESTRTLHSMTKYLLHTKDFSIQAYHANHINKNERNDCVSRQNTIRGIRFPRENSSNQITSMIRIQSPQSYTIHATVNKFNDKGCPYKKKRWGGI